MSVSHLGHVELLVPDVEASVDFLTKLIGVNVGPIEDEQAFNIDKLGIKHRYYGRFPDGRLAFSFFSANALSHELSMVRNFRDTDAELHHLCYFLDSAADVYNQAVMLSD